MSDTTTIEIPEGALIGSADDPTSPQPRDGDRVLVLERPAMSKETLRIGQVGRVAVRPALNWRGRPSVAAGCPWVHVVRDDGTGEETGLRLLAKKWAILP